MVTWCNLFTWSATTGPQPDWLHPERRCAPHQCLCSPVMASHGEEGVISKWLTWRFPKSLHHDHLVMTNIAMETMAMLEINALLSYKMVGLSISHGGAQETMLVNQYSSDHPWRLDDNWEYPHDKSETATAYGRFGPPFCTILPSSPVVV